MEWLHLKKNYRPKAPQVDSRSPCNVVQCRWAAAHQREVSRDGVCARKSLGSWLVRYTARGQQNKPTVAVPTRTGRGRTECRVRDHTRGAEAKKTRTLESCQLPTHTFPFYTRSRTNQPRDYLRGSSTEKASRFVDRRDLDRRALHVMKTVHLLNEKREKTLQ